MAAVIGDVVGSRSHPERVRLQAAVVAALAEADSRIPGVQATRPTIGDEFQALFADLASALEATLMIRLLLREEADVRFGIGWGVLTLMDEGVAPFGQDGPAWWAARAAVQDLRKRSTAPGSPRGLRTAFKVDESATRPPGWEGLVNALLTCRDHIVSSMDGRDARLLLGLIHGRGQDELARSEGVSQPAVSQRLHRNGSYAILDAHLLLKGT
jgi:hypothetical protein